MLLVFYFIRNIPYRYTGHFKTIKFTAVLLEITNKKRKGIDVCQKDTCEIWYVHTMEFHKVVKMR